MRVQQVRQAGAHYSSRVSMGGKKVENPPEGSRKAVLLYVAGVVVVVLCGSGGSMRELGSP